MSGRQPGGGHHDASRQGSDKHTNQGKQGQPRAATRENVEELEREMERTQPELSDEDRERFRGAGPGIGNDGPGPRGRSHGT
jgi:hypothetical protein